MINTEPFKIGIHDINSILTCCGLYNFFARDKLLQYFSAIIKQVKPKSWHILKDALSLKGLQTPKLGTDPL